MSTNDETRALQTAAARDVLAERRRQIEREGWTPEHDDEHDDAAIACAAGCYALAAGGYELPAYWPGEWDFKRSDQRRMLVKAGALILAEIERLDRKEETSRSLPTATGSVPG